MYAMDALKIAAERTGTTLYRISVDIGKSRQYANSVITRGSNPQCDTMSKMLNVCGYGLFAMPLDKVPKEALRID